MRSLKKTTSASNFVYRALAEALTEDSLVSYVFAGVMFAFCCCVSFGASYGVNFVAYVDANCGSHFGSNFGSNSGSNFEPNSGSNLDSSFDVF